MLGRPRRDEPSGEEPRRAAQLAFESRVPPAAAQVGSSGEDESAYASLAEAIGGEARWAYGTGFADPLSGMDTTVPDGVDAGALAQRCLSLGDDALVLAQRLASWCSNAPDLEEEMALANVGLDLLGQARMLLTRAAAADPQLRPPAVPPHVLDEDALAYFREPPQFRNVVLAELDDDGDFARCMVRLLLLSSWRLAIMQRLRTADDPVLAAIAAKAVPELTYHRDYAAQWAVRLGDGTEESHRRMQDALVWSWPYLDELHADVDVRTEFEPVLDRVLTGTTLRRPGIVPGAAGRGRAGEHTEALTALLAELQSVARADPEAIW